MAELLFKVRADTGNTASALQRLLTPLTSIGKQSDKASASLNKLGKTDVTPQVDTKAISTAITTAEHRLAELRSRMVEEVTLGVDTRATTAAIRRVESDLKVLRNQRAKIPVEVDTTRATSALGRLKTAMAGVRSGLGTGLQKVGAGFSGLASGVSSFFSNLNVPLVGALGVGLTLLASKAAGAVTGMVMLADTLENNKIAFTTLLGSAGQADKFLVKLQKFGDATPFEFPELVAASKKLLAFGFSGKEIIPLMTTLGDAAANTGADVEALAVIFGQMKAKGKLATEDILQLVEAGIPAWGILADKMGLTVAQVQDLATKGKLGAKEFKQLQEGMDETFGGGMEKSAATLSGMISTLQDTWSGIQTKIGDAILPIAKAIMPMLQEGLNNLGSTIVDRLPSLSDALGDFALVLIGLPTKILSGLSVVVTGLLTGLASVQAGLGSFLISMAGLVGPIAQIVNVLAPLTGMVFDTKGLQAGADAAKAAGEGMLGAAEKTRQASALAGAQLDRWAASYEKSAAKAKTAVSGAKAAFAINLSTNAATSKVDKLKKDLASLGKKKSSPSVDAKTDKAKAKLAAAEKWLKQLNKYKANPSILAKDLASGKVAIVNGKLKRMKGKTVDIHAADKTGPGVNSAKKNVNSVHDKTVTITTKYEQKGRAKAGGGDQSGDFSRSAVSASVMSVSLEAPAAPAPTVVLSVRDEALSALLDVRINGQAVAASRILRRRDLLQI